MKDGEMRNKTCHKSMTSGIVKYCNGSDCMAALKTDDDNYICSELTQR